MLSKRNVQERSNRSSRSNRGFFATFGSFRTSTSFGTGKTSGFTLVEVLIAAAIFVIFAGAMIALFSLNAKNVVVNKHRLEATNLAREGIELVTQIKQTASTREDDWESGCWNISNGDRVLNASGCGNTWGLDNDTGAHETISLSGTIPYTRVIYIDDDSGAKKITVTVSWDDYGIGRSATAVTYLTKWQ